MGSIQTTNNHRKRYRIASSTKPNGNLKHKPVDRFRTTMRSITLRAIAARNYQNSVSSSYDSTINNSSFTSPTTITTINSEINTDPYLSDFDYKKLSTLTDLSESKINELHREFLILSHNGRLSYERYKSMLETIPNQKPSIQLDKLARQTFTVFDKDGNNYLDFAEFIAAYITMEKNELFLTDKSQRKQSSMSPTRPTITSVTREAATYYSPQRSLVNTSPILSSRLTYLPTNNTSYYHPQSSERYVYTTSQYAFR
jgi:predicted nucleic acid-binding protein